MGRRPAPSGRLQPAVQARGAEATAQSDGSGRHAAARTPASLPASSHPLPRSYPEVCLRLQAALPGTVACYRMAHVEEQGSGAPPAEAEPQSQAAGTQAEPIEAAEAEAAGQLGSGGAPAGAERAASDGEDGGGDEEGSGATAAADAADASAADAAGAGDGSGVALEAEAGRALAAREAQLAAAALGHVVFLFKLVPGVAPASYGLNVARMAQLPDSVIRSAAERAAAAQAAYERRRGGAAAAAPSGQAAAGGAGEAAALAERVRAFLRISLQPGGPGVDAEAGRALQQRARQLLGAGA